MPDIVVTFVFMGMGGIYGGGVAISEGHYVGGPCLILGGLFFLWLLFASIHRKERRYQYTPANCPHKGKRPVHGMFKGGFHWYKYSVGEDDNTIVKCEGCGYTDYHADINPLTQLSSDTFGIHPNIDLLPIHP